MDKQRKKEIITEYKLKETTGGIYRIYNIDTGNSLIKGDVNLEAVENRFLFSKKINSAFTLTIAADWAKYGSDGFAIEIIEEIKPENEESSKAFRDRLKKLEGLHKEKYPEELLY